MTPPDHPRPAIPPEPIAYEAARALDPWGDAPTEASLDNPRFAEAAVVTVDVTGAPTVTTAWRSSEQWLRQVVERARSLHLEVVRDRLGVLDRVDADLIRYEVARQTAAGDPGMQRWFVLAGPAGVTVTVTVDGDVLRSDPRWRLRPLEDDQLLWQRTIADLRDHHALTALLLARLADDGWVRQDADEDLLINPNYQRQL